jgi:hypothetical protein
VLAVLTLGILGCQDSASSSPPANDAIVIELAAKYQAITGWEENLAYTLQAQERLITGKPILFRGYVDDVFRRDGKLFVRLWSVDFIFELECSRAIVDVILTQQSYAEIAVVALIQEVSKPVIALRAAAISEDEVEIHIDSSGLFAARGTCIDIAYIARGAQPPAPAAPGPATQTEAFNEIIAKYGRGDFGPVNSEAARTEATFTIALLYETMGLSPAAALDQAIRDFGSQVGK